MNYIINDQAEKLNKILKIRLSCSLFPFIRTGQRNIFPKKRAYQTIRRSQRERTECNNRH